MNFKVLHCGNKKEFELKFRTVTNSLRRRTMVRNVSLNSTPLITRTRTSLLDHGRHNDFLRGGRVFERQRRKQSRIFMDMMS